jgi:hypothetical protein
MDLVTLQQRLCKIRVAGELHTYFHRKYMAELDRRSQLDRQRHRNQMARCQKMAENMSRMSRDVRCLNVYRICPYLKYMTRELLRTVQRREYVNR